jgi:hypothetical protein
VNKMKKILTFSLVSIAFAFLVVPVFAVAPGAAVKNENANSNACWGMDRAYYASMKFFGDNMDIKQSFPGDVGGQRQAWVETYCVPHGPAAE